MGRRTILLIVAVVVAAMGTALVFMYASKAEESALAGQEPVQVLVATTGIESGTAGAAISQAGTAELTTLPSVAVPQGALSDLTPVAELVTTGSIYPGQVLLQPMFGTQQQAAGGLSLPEGTMGVAVQLEDSQRVAGFVNPGSEVAVFVTSTPSGQSVGLQEATAETSLLLERVRVVAVGPSTVSTTSTTEEGTTNTEEIPTAILTLALNQKDAQKVILAASSAQLYFALLDPESKVSIDVASASATDLVN